MTEAPTTIEHEDNGSKGRYFLRAPGGAIAETTYTNVGQHQIIIDHTEVPDAFRGQGAGLRLVTRAVEDARAAARKALAAPTSADVTRCLVEGIGDSVDLKVFQGRWSLSLPE